MLPMMQLDDLIRDFSVCHYAKVDHWRAISRNHTKFIEFMTALIFVCNVKPSSNKYADKFIHSFLQLCCCILFLALNMEEHCETLFTVLEAVLVNLCRWYKDKIQFCRRRTDSASAYQRPLLRIRLYIQMQTNLLVLFRISTRSCCAYSKQDKDEGIIPTSGAFSGHVYTTFGIHGSFPVFKKVYSNNTNTNIVFFFRIR